MSFIDLKYLTSAESKEMAKDRSAVGLIPVGAFEQHGPHLPLATDSIMVEVMAAEVAARFKEPIIVTPTLMAGLSEHHVDFPGTVTLDPVTLEGEIDAYITALQQMGLTRVCLFSFHGGNYGFLHDYAASARSKWPNIQIITYTDFQRFLTVMFNAGLKAGLQLAATDSHAGALETSLILHVLGENRVREFAGVTGFLTEDPSWMETMQKQGVQAISPSGVFGTPASASPAAGEMILDALVEEVASWLKVSFKLEDHT